MEIKVERNSGHGELVVYERRGKRERRGSAIETQSTFRYVITGLLELGRVFVGHIVGHPAVIQRVQSRLKFVLFISYVITVAQSFGTWESVRWAYCRSPLGDSLIQRVQSRLNFVLFISYAITVARDVRPRGLASASRPKNLASASASASWVGASGSASASWVVASASWVLASSLEASRGLQPKRNRMYVIGYKSITNSQKSIMPLRTAS